VSARRAGAAFAVLCWGCGAAAPAGAVRPEAGATQTGKATWYSDSLAGRPTASGEPYDPGELTAAHRTLPFGTRVRVTNLRNDRSVVVRVNDRGPFGRADRIIDLSRAAAEGLEMIRAGVVPVRLEVVSAP
jgi:rare lipoprotein A